MTTAHRPTFHNALGGTHQGGNYLVLESGKVSSRDLPGHTTLKHRQAAPAPLYTTNEAFDEGASGKDDRKHALKVQLELKERAHLEEKAKAKSVYAPLEALADFSSLKNHIPAALLPDPTENPFPEDADDCGPQGIGLSDNGSQSSDSGSEGSDSDDEEAELMRELERIKQERREEELKRKQQEEAAKAPENRLRILTANPLLMRDGKDDNEAQDVLKRRWDDDVVFRNQAKGIPKPKKRFINDTVRSDFHRRFLARYIQ